MGKSGEASLLGAIAELKKKFSSLKVPRELRKAGVLVFKINQNEDFNLWDVIRCDTILRDSVYIDVKIEDFEEIEGASLRLEGPVRARALAALVTRESESVMVEACAKAIAESDIWQDIVAEVASNSEICPAVVRLLSGILQARWPQNPLARISHIPKFAFSVNDAIKSDALTTFDAPDDLSGQHNCMVFDIQDPVDHCVVLTLDFDMRKVVLHTEAVPWLAGAICACPAFAIVAAE